MPDVVGLICFMNSAVTRVRELHRGHREGAQAAARSLLASAHVKFSHTVKSLWFNKVACARTAETGWVCVYVHAQLQ